MRLEECPQIEKQLIFQLFFILSAILEITFYKTSRKRINIINLNKYDKHA